ncbi:hypothetical protein SKAU_G00043780 [Synaphobranchus kaupii]|uniref:Uncharacterized protein n=1 Tax=Synaphobranchus kaupii TaxID=118154 RepID=A0A9Q1G2H6_SYNKA|nr:hypothetical protein SKAU_G00043780 [Synaphobranchus kaupii]
MRQQAAVRHEGSVERGGRRLRRDVGAVCRAKAEQRVAGQAVCALRDQLPCSMGRGGWAGDRGISLPRAHPVRLSPPRPASCAVHEQQKSPLPQTHLTSLSGALALVHLEGSVMCAGRPCGLGRREAPADVGQEVWRAGGAGLEEKASGSTAPVPAGER